MASGEIKGWTKDWGRAVKVHKTLDEVSAKNYDAIVLPGAQINPDLLRVEPKALKFIKDIFEAKKVASAICQVPWLLIVAKGRKSMKTDMANAGPQWEDSEIVVDEGVIASRNPADLEAFFCQDHRRGIANRYPCQALQRRIRTGPDCFSTHQRPRQIGNVLNKSIHQLNFVGMR